MAIHASAAVAPACAGICINITTGSGKGFAIALHYKIACWSTPLGNGFQTIAPIANRAIASCRDKSFPIWSGNLFDRHAPSQPNNDSDSQYDVHFYSIFHNVAFTKITTDIRQLNTATSSCVSSDSLALLALLLSHLVRLDEMKSSGFIWRATLIIWVSKDNS